MPYAVLEEKIRSLPEEYYQLVSDYIDTITTTETPPRVSARGIAAKYANPSLIESEKLAMSNAFGEKTADIPVFSFDKKLNHHLKNS